MNRKAIAVCVCTFLALVAATVWVPVVRGTQTRFRESEEDIRELVSAIREGGEVPDAYVERRVQLARGEWVRGEAPWPPRYVPVWDLGLVSVDPGWVGGGFRNSQEWRQIDRVYWPTLLSTHALILLLGGGLLTWVVRRERRRKAAA